ncbi:ORF52-like protein [Bufonid herpesvirus 1]|uniref:ORF52-like protein n=1 Tax=Bufonid herpesvirus 1 TaxID=2282206 RepID=UPI000EB71C77|nr:ORF52-like protein [Bufonid herpesvirus 1]AXF48592.1 ORF52-like protein [Bufonid herpesvirus 1]
MSSNAVWATSMGSRHRNRKVVKRCDMLPIPLLVGTDWVTPVVGLPCPRLSQLTEVLYRERCNAYKARTQALLEKCAGPYTKATVLSSCPPTDPLVCLTRDSFFEKMNLLLKKDKILEQVLCQVAAEEDLGHTVEVECMSRMQPFPASTVRRVSKLIAEKTAGQLEVYIKYVYRHFLDWFVTLGCVPIAFANIKEATSAGPLLYQRFSFKLVGLDEISIYAKNESYLRACLFEQLSFGGGDILNEPVFLHELGLDADIAVIVADMFSSIPFSDKRAVFGFITLLRSLNNGFVPYIPPVNHGVDVVYDPITRTCKACDNMLHVYDVVVSNFPAEGTPPDSICSINYDFAIKFASTTNTIFAATEVSCQRVAVITQQDHPDKAKQKAIDVAVTDDSVRLAVQDLLSSHNQQNALRRRLADMNTGLNMRPLNHEDNLARLAVNQDVEILRTVLLDYAHTADNYNTVIAAFGSLINGEPLQPSLLENLSMRDSQLIYSAALKIKSTESVVNSDLTAHLVQAPRNSKLLCAFDRPNPIDALKDILYTWNAFWSTNIFGVSMYKSKRSIEYSSNKDNNTASVMPTNIFIKSIWDSILQYCEFPITVNNRGVKEMSVDEILRVSTLFTDPVSKAAFVADRLKVSPSDIV